MYELDNIFKKVNIYIYDKHVNTLSQWFSILDITKG